MKAFRHYVPTCMYFGTNCVKENKSVFANYGKRAYIVTDEFYAGCRNYALEDVEEVLKELGIEYAVTDKTEDNPPVESCVAITAEARKFAPDFIIGIGGGSALDTAKAVDFLLTQPEDVDVYGVLFGGAPFYAHVYNELKLPLIGIPTTAGTGSEVTGGTVLTRNDVDNKDTAHHKLYCFDAFLDARYIRESPDFLIYTGAMDALAHGVETYINIKSNPMNRAVAAVGMQLFSEYKDNMLNNCLTDEDFEKMMMTSNIMGQAFMQAGTCLPHGMGYPLSHYKGVNHGLSCSVTLGEWLRGFKDQSIVAPVVKMCGFNNTDEMADYINELLARAMHITVTRDEIVAWAKQFCSNPDKISRNPEPVTVDGIIGIYNRALAKYIVD